MTEKLIWRVTIKTTGWRCSGCRSKIERSDRYAIEQGKPADKYCSRCKHEEYQ